MLVPSLCSGVLCTPVHQQTTGNLNMASANLKGPPVGLFLKHGHDVSVNLCIIPSSTLDFLKDWSQET